jgi:hypothetical protein
MKTLQGIMRVSVVATGIDATDGKSRMTPLPRRSMAEPLAKDVETEPILQLSLKRGQLEPTYIVFKVPRVQTRVNMQ